MSAVFVLIPDANTEEELREKIESSLAEYEKFFISRQPDKTPLTKFEKATIRGYLLWLYKKQEGEL